jgi:hypothetical protein
LLVPGIHLLDYEEVEMVELVLWEKVVSPLVCHIPIMTHEVTTIPKAVPPNIANMVLL